MARSSASLFVIPSSLASSCNRMFFGTFWFQPFVLAAQPTSSAACNCSMCPPRCPCTAMATSFSSASINSELTDRLHARSNARRDTAVRKHVSESVQSQALRPATRSAARPHTGRWSAATRQRNSCATGRTCRQPMHVRSGVCIRLRHHPRGCRRPRGSRRPRRRAPARCRRPHRHWHAPTRHGS